MWQSWWSCPYGRQNGRNCSNHPWPRIQSQFWTSSLNPKLCFVVTYLLLPVTKKCHQIVTDWVMPKPIINTCHPLLFLYSPFRLLCESFLWVIHLYLYLFPLCLKVKRSRIFKKCIWTSYIILYWSPAYTIIRIDRTIVSLWIFRSYESLTKVLLPELYLYPVSDLHSFWIKQVVSILVKGTPISSVWVSGLWFLGWTPIYMKCRIEHLSG